MCFLYFYNVIIMSDAYEGRMKITPLKSGTRERYFSGNYKKRDYKTLIYVLNTIFTYSTVKTDEILG